MDCYDWSAWYNRMPGTDDPNLRVVGTCQLNSSSQQLKLVPVADGVVDEPDLQTLRLVVETPDFGPTDIAERQVSWEGDVGPDIKRVKIQGAAEAEIEVIITT
ncbi:MAG TPA: hypothetical protein VEW93_06880 [Acidimicrobiales bacterium]|nr:hypothetical protein [Acidimicrobiales bacterium]